jgi:hypothetical protein
MKRKAINYGPHVSAGGKKIQAKGEFRQNAKTGMSHKNGKAVTEVSEIMA